MSFRLPSRMVISPRCRALVNTRWRAVIPSGPQASKKALCGFTTGVKGATMSMTRLQNSSYARATAPKLSAPCRWRISSGNDSQRGSRPTHKEFPLARQAEDKRSAKCLRKSIIPSMFCAQHNRRTRVTDLHHKINRDMDQHADRDIVDWRGVGGSLEDDVPLVAGLVAQAEQGLAFALVDGHAGRQWIAEDAAQ